MSTRCCDPDISPLWENKGISNLIHKYINYFWTKFKCYFKRFKKCHQFLSFFKCSWQKMSPYNICTCPPLAGVLTSFTTYFSRFSAVFSFKDPCEQKERQRVCDGLRLEAAALACVNVNDSTLKWIQSTASRTSWNMLLKDMKKSPSLKPASQLRRQVRNRVTVSMEFCGDAEICRFDVSK